MVSCILYFNEQCFLDTNLFTFLQVFAKGIDADAVILMAARASRIENQDAIDAAIVGMLADPKEVCQSRLSFWMEYN